MDAPDGFLREQTLKTAIRSILIIPVMALASMLSLAGATAAGALALAENSPALAKNNRAPLGRYPPRQKPAKINLENVVKKLYENPTGR